MNTPTQKPQTNAERIRRLDEITAKAEGRDQKTYGSPAVVKTEPHSRALTVVGAGNSQDEAMGRQITAQYPKACGGMTEVLIFGAMMMHLQQVLTSRVKSKHEGQGRYPSESGLKSWLKEFAPSVNETTAYRFLHVAEVVRHEFPLPAKVDFIALATTAPEELNDKLRLKQSELWEFVNGTSQRSWLDRFVPKRPSGYHPPKQLTPQERQEKLDAMAQERLQDFYAQVVALQNEEKDRLLRIPVQTPDPMQQVSLVMLRDQIAALLDLIKSAIKHR